MSKWDLDEFFTETTSMDLLMRETTAFDKVTEYRSAATSQMILCAPQDSADAMESLSLREGPRGEKIPLRTFAMPSLLDRARIGGKALSLMSPKSVAGIVNKCLRVAPKKNLSTLVVVADKLSAARSEYYIPLPAAELLEIANRRIRQRFPNTVFTRGYLSQHRAGAVYELNEQLATPISFGDKEFSTMLEVTTSVIGESGANLTPSIKVGNEAFSIGDAIRMDHIGSASLDRFDANCQMCHSLVKKAVTEFSELKQIQITHPTDTLLNVAKRIGFSKKYALLAAEDLISVLPGAYCTAFEIYFAFCQAVLMAKNDGATPQKILSLKEQAARALALKWTDYDYPSAQSLRDVLSA